MRGGQTVIIIIDNIFGWGGGGQGGGGQVGSVWGEVKFLGEASPVPLSIDETA